MINKKIESDLYNLRGEIIGKTPLPEEIFTAEIKPELLSQAVRVYLANQRLGTHSTKTRSEVSGSTRKIYRQKGTGKARHGDVKAPIFIGGGLAFGPKPRDYFLKIPKKMKRAAFFASLTEKYMAGKIKVISGLNSIEPKTRIMADMLGKIYDKDKKKKENKIILVTPNYIKNVFLSGRNFPNLDTREATLLNTYDVISHSDILFMEEAISVLKDHFIKKEEIIRDKTIKKQPSKDLTGKPAGKITARKKALKEKSVKKSRDK